MGREHIMDPGPPSPLDPYILEALALVESRGDIPASSLAQVCSHELGWLPGFCEVVVTVLRTNRLITVNEWEPGKLHISANGKRWMATRSETSVIS